MRDCEDDGKLQVIAAMSLLRCSRLIRWETTISEFVPVDHDSFESDWRRDVDPVCGRLICWISFSTGAEFLAKGVCLLRDVEVRRSEGGSTKYGTLGNLWKKPAHLRQLCAVVKAESGQQERLLATYKCLTDHRNRDAHGYVPNVRDTHFKLVNEIFAPSFNLLVSWLPEGPKSLNSWVRSAQQFIASQGLTEPSK